MNFLRSAEDKARLEADAIEKKMNAALILRNGDDDMVLAQIIKIIEEQQESYFKELKSPLNEEKMTEAEFVRKIISNKNKFDALEKLKHDIQRTAEKAGEYRQAESVTEIN